MKYLIIAIVMLTSSCAFAEDFKIIDSLGYRLYHDMDNERDGAKLRLYVGKQTLHFGKFKIAYERKRSGSGIEAGTMFIDQSFKF